MNVLEDSLCLDDSKGFPPGFRFHPTDEELVLYYLKRKICRRRLRMNIIGEADVYKWDPEDLPGQSKLKTGDRQWFFFSPRERKYPNGGRSNRATRHGYWKVTGKDRNIKCNSLSVGVKKTLVFYKGRAPSGERTDWVMHEYTLDEEELKRCQSAQDYYALCKLYKKSGPGPKNGEQYGAPFREEDWVDDEYINGHTNVGNSVRQGNAFTSMDSVGVTSQEVAALYDIPEFLNQIAEHPGLDPALTFSCDNTLQQFVGEEEDQSTLVDNLSRDIIIPNWGLLPHPQGQQHDMLTSFDLMQSSISQLQPYEAPEVKSATNINGEKPYVAEEDFLGDYLEVNDLLGPEPTVQNSQVPVENLQFDEIDGLSMLDLYHDAAMFLCDIEPDETEHLHEQCMNNFENGVIAQSLNPYLNSIENDAINYQPQHQPINADQASCQLWAHEQRDSIYSPTEANHCTIPPATSGVYCDGAFTNNPVEANQNHICKEDNASESWFSSTIWTFVESIPSAPASAAESPLVNRALERMSSFSRMRINSRNTNAVARKPIATSSNSCRSKIGFICMSIFGVICAILWMLIR